MSQKHPIEGPRFSTYRCCLRRHCNWGGTDRDCIEDIPEEDDHPGCEIEYLCPACGAETRAMNAEEIVEWQDWQRHITEAYRVLMSEWLCQPKPRQGKRPTRDDAKRLAFYHRTH